MFMASAAMGGVRDDREPFVPGAHLAPGAFALVAMGAVFGAASRATFTFIIFAFEITRDYNSVLPLMLVSVIADCDCHAVAAQIDHDGEAGAARAAHSPGLRSRRPAAGERRRDHGSGSPDPIRRYNSPHSRRPNRES